MAQSARSAAVPMVLALVLMGGAFWWMRDSKSSTTATTVVEQQSNDATLESSREPGAIVAAPAERIPVVKTLPDAAVEVPRQTPGAPEIPSISVVPAAGAHGTVDASLYEVQHDMQRADEVFAFQWELLTRPERRASDLDEFRETFVEALRPQVTESMMNQCRAQVSLREQGLTPDWRHAMTDVVDGHRVLRVNIKGFGGIAFHQVEGNWQADEIWCAPRLP